MKLQLSKFFVLIAFTSAFFAGCADTESPQKEVSEYYVMDRWMKKNRPDVPFIDSGYYYKITKPDVYLDTTTIADSTLVEFYSDAKYLDGEVFLNSDPYKARQLGQFTYETRYVPYRIITENYSYPFTNIGVRATILKMKMGESAEIFLSGDNSYGDVEESVDQYSGFGGSVAFVANSISKFDIKITAIEQSPKDTVMNSVIEYATKILKVNAKDSVKRGMYVKRIDSLGGGNFVGQKDTMVQLRYTGKFLDGFVFDTNDKEVAKANNIYNPSNAYATMSFKNRKTGATISDSDQTYIVAFTEAVRYMKPGDKAVMISIPEWCYEESGNFNEVGTLIQSYMPLIFEMEIIIPE